MSVTYGGRTNELRAGELLHMCPGELLSVKGLEYSCLLLPVRLPLSGQVAEAGERLPDLRDLSKDHRVPSAGTGTDRGQ